MKIFLLFVLFVDKEFLFKKKKKELGGRFMLEHVKKRAALGKSGLLSAMKIPQLSEV